MEAGTLVRTARRRARLTQEDLARRTGVTQPTIARIEGGRSDPALRQLRELVEACGLDLEVGLGERDDSNWSVASTNLRLTPDQRARQHAAALRFAVALRGAGRDQERRG